MSGGIPATEDTRKHHCCLDATTTKTKAYQLEEKVKIHTSLQAVDVLRVHPQELPLVVKQPHKIMGEIGLVAPWIQLFGQSKERIWVVMEKVNLKYGLCVGQVVLLQVVIETAAWRPVEQICADLYLLRVPRQDATRAALLPEVWDAAGGADASAGHHHHPPVVLLPDALGDLLQGLRLLTRAAAMAE